MCGRYVIYTEKEAMEINEIIREVERKVGQENKMKTGEIFPTDLAPVLIYEHNNIVPILMNWGFPNFKNKGVIINARAETAADKPTFKEAVMTRRCVVPASGFFEWKKTTDSKKKEKYLFEMPESSIIYMAGLYNKYKSEGNRVSERFVILTTQANESMMAIHDRMPIVLLKDQVEEWIKNSNSARHILNIKPPNLSRSLA